MARMLYTRLLWWEQTLTKPSKAIDKIKTAAKPAITPAQLKKAKEFVAAGGSIDAIESKYKLTEVSKSILNDIKSKNTQEA